MGWEEIGTLMGMLLAVAAVLLLAYLFTRFLAGRGLGGTPFSRYGKRSENLRVLERLPLGREQYLAVVQIGEQCLLLGVTPAGITLLRDLSGEESVLWKEPPSSAFEGGRSTPMRFQDVLQEVLKQKKR